MAVLPITRELPTLAVTDPIWQWLFKHGWEDPEWGKTPAAQVLVATLIHEMATSVVDERLRAQIKEGARQVAAQALERFG